MWIRLLSCLLLPFMLVVLLSGCGGSSSYAPASSRGDPRDAPPVYVVRRGDTLYSIAWEYGLDYRHIARINGIKRPYTIYVGQRIRLKTATRKPAVASQGSRTARHNDTTRQSSARRKPVDSASQAASSRIRWDWPANGPLLSTYSAQDPHRKGIDIAGKNGQPIKAAADGKVVYSGSGLIGLGMLIIVKHDETYLSAYAHNRKLLVNEGEQVKRGQTIAEMGQTGTDRVKLHFEIRHNGNTLDPLRFLPRR
jgi:lipoprotein NlpD